ncbi:unnamed protein product [Owenia fusiformis]|uniref:Uncharacterized protein n=1 Tax=Owenia fusiformis TaxID=6347 RepID=A0A8S4N2Z4_OWEFU|nr:unnamed protein product [Owenia fusiformis]
MLFNAAGMLHVVLLVVSLLDHAAGGELNDGTELYECISDAGNFVDVFRFCCDILKCKDKCCDEPELICQCCASTESRLMLPPLELTSKLTLGKGKEDLTCTMKPYEPGKDSLKPDFRPGKVPDQRPEHVIEIKPNVTVATRYYLPELCCDIMARDGKCKSPFVCCYTDTKPFCACGRPTNEVASMFKYVPIRSQRKGSVTVSLDRVKTVTSRLRNDSKNLCFAQSSMEISRDGTGPEWASMSMNTMCCDIWGPTFVGGCCHKPEFQYCYDCADDPARRKKRQNGEKNCLVRVSKEMNFININGKSRSVAKTPVFSFAAFCCSIMKCKMCRSAYRWPFCRCSDSKIPDSSLSPIPRHIDSRYDACCASKNCKEDCCFDDVYPFCKCCPCGQGAQPGRIIKKTNRKMIGKLTNAKCAKPPPICITTDESITLPNYVDLYLGCCKDSNCQNKCCRTQKGPYCKCCDMDTTKAYQYGTVGNRNNAKCNVGDFYEEACHVQVAPPMAILARTPEITKDKCQSQIFVYEICCAIRRCAKGACCVAENSTRAAATCYCCGDEIKPVTIPRTLEKIADN